MRAPETETWVLDLDGVCWLADDVIPGSPEAVARLRSSGRRIAFFTNNSFITTAGLLEKFARLGYLGVQPPDVFSSSRVAAGLCEPGEKAYVIGGLGIREALRERGVEVLELGDLAKITPDAVLIGLDPFFDYPKLGGALTAINAGARLIGTNEDATYPTPSGLIPGGGAILAAVTYASGVKPIIAGKPNQPSVDLLRERLGAIDVVVGDRPSSDGRLALALGARFALVRSGVTAPGATPEEPHADLDAPDLASLVAALEG